MKNKNIIKFAIIMTLVNCLLCCSSPEPTTKSPFSHLDTVKTKAVEKKEAADEPKGLTSPFSGLDKK